MDQQTASNNVLRLPDQPRLWNELQVNRYEFPVYALGTDPEQARSAIVCVHNRTSSAERFIRLGQSLLAPEDAGNVAIIALGAPEYSTFWYPKEAFDSPLETQHPYLEFSLAALEQLCLRLADHISIEDVSLFGFADGGCLVLEYMVRCGYPLNAVLALSGVLLGSSLESSDRFSTASTRTKVLLTIGGGISAALRVRFRQTEQLLKQFGYKVIALSYERRPDTIAPDELAMARNIIYGTFAAE
jgi:predicted esterase